MKSIVVPGRQAIEMSPKLIIKTWLASLFILRLLKTTKNFMINLNLLFPFRNLRRHWIQSSATATLSVIHVKS